jgi:undecaprenyl diphosphate synthase
LKDVARWAWKAEIEQVTVYAFSTENWERSKEEVRYLTEELLEHALTTGLKELIEEGARVRFIGERERFSERFQRAMQTMEERTRDSRAGTLVVALSYGGRAEILGAVQKLIEDGVPASEHALRERMWSAGLLDPDLIIRTGGEERLSNFLTWQSVYSELYFTRTLWPDFNEEEFRAICASVSARERRMGK